MPSWLAGSLAKDEPQTVYSDDPADCWNRIFYHLFTRALKIRLTDDFPEARPIPQKSKPLRSLRRSGTSQT
jgi:hypothetical protein